MYSKIFSMIVMMRVNMIYYIMSLSLWIIFFWDCLDSFYLWGISGRWMKSWREIGSGRRNKREKEKGYWKGNEFCREFESWRWRGVWVEKEYGRWNVNEYRESLKSDNDLNESKRSDDVMRSVSVSVFVLCFIGVE